MVRRSMTARAPGGGGLTIRRALVVESGLIQPLILPQSVSTALVDQLDLFFLCFFSGCHTGSNEEKLLIETLLENPLQYGDKVLMLAEGFFRDLIATAALAALMTSSLGEVDLLLPIESLTNILLVKLLTATLSWSSRGRRRAYLHSGGLRVATGLLQDHFIS